MKILHISIIIGIGAFISALGFILLPYWHDHQHGTPIPSMAGVEYQTYVMKHNISSGNYISFEYFNPPSDNQSIIIDNPSKMSFRDCLVYESNGSDKIIINRMSMIEQNLVLHYILNNTHKYEINKLHFSCEIPKFDIFWPNLVLDKKDYKHGDALTLNGSLSPKSSIQVLVFEPVEASNLVHELVANPYTSQNVSTDTYGNFSFLYNIPIDQANGSWIVGIKDGSDEYYLVFRVGV